MFKCDKCRCIFKKEVSLNQHKNQKHAEPNTSEGKKLGERMFGHVPGLTPEKEIYAETLQNSGRKDMLSTLKTETNERTSISHLSESKSIRDFIRMDNLSAKVITGPKEL